MQSVCSSIAFALYRRTENKVKMPRSMHRVPQKHMRICSISPSFYTPPPPTLKGPLGGGGRGRGKDAVNPGCGEQGWGVVHAGLLVIFQGLSGCWVHAFGDIATSSGLLGLVTRSKSWLKKQI